MIRELITDADILSGRVRSPIVLREGVCLTPAARDRAVARGMQIVESRDAHASHGAACARCGRPADACASGCAGGCGGTAASTLGHASTSAAPACAGPHGSAQLDQLADGVYLLRVSGGRVASILPASGPGLLQAGRASTPSTHGSRPT